MKPLILPYKGEYAPDGVSPIISDEAFIAHNVVITGDVHIGAGTGIWFNCAMRGDVNTIRIGEKTNIQDGTIIHVTRRTAATNIGSRVTVGHSALLHGCTLEDDCFVGMSATVMDGALVKSGGMLAAGALLTPGKVVPKGQLWAGNPAKYFRELTDKEIAFIGESAKNYYKHALEYQALK